MNNVTNDEIYKEKCSDDVFETFILVSIQENPFLGSTRIFGRKKFVIRILSCFRL